MRQLAAFLLVLSTLGCTSAAAPSASPAVDSPQPTLPPSPSPMASPAVSAAPPSTAPGAGRIIFQSSSGLAVVRSDGTQFKLLFTGAGSPPEAAHADWSPDGSRVAFQAGVDGDWDIWVANADGSGAQILIDCQSPCIQYDAPAWSPDGTRIAFDRLDDRDGEYPAYVQVLDLASGEIKTVAEIVSGDWATAARWSPDGRFLAVTYEHYENPFQPDEKKLPSRIGIVDTADPGEVTIFEGLPEWSWYPDWHPERDEIIFTGGSEKWLDHETEPSNLYSVRPDGSGLTQLTDFSDEENWVAMPAWAPDGQSILVTLITRVGELRLGRLSPDGSVVEGIGQPWVAGAHSRETWSKPRP